MPRSQSRLVVHLLRHGVGIQPEVESHGVGGWAGPPPRRTLTVASHRVLSARLVPSARRGQATGGSGPGGCGIVRAVAPSAKRRPQHTRRDSAPRGHSSLTLHRMMAKEREGMTLPETRGVALVRVRVRVRARVRVTCRRRGGWPRRRSPRRRSPT